MALVLYVDVLWLLVNVKISCFFNFSVYKSCSKSSANINNFFFAAVLLHLSFLYTQRYLIFWFLYSENLFYILRGPIDGRRFVSAIFICLSFS